MGLDRLVFEVHGRADVAERPRSHLLRLLPDGLLEARVGDQGVHELTVHGPSHLSELADADRVVELVPLELGETRRCDLQARRQGLLAHAEAGSNGADPAATGSCSNRFDACRSEFPAKN